MHTASIHRENILNSRDYGWNLDAINDPMIDSEPELEKKFVEKFIW